MGDLSQNLCQLNLKRGIQDSAQVKTTLVEAALSRKQVYVLPVYLNLSYGSPETGSCPNSQNTRTTYPLDKRVVLDVKLLIRELSQMLSLLPIMDHLSSKSESLTVQKTKKYYFGWRYIDVWKDKYRQYKLLIPTSIIKGFISNTYCLTSSLF